MKAEHVDEKLNKCLFYGIAVLVILAVACFVCVFVNAQNISDLKDKFENISIIEKKMDLFESDIRTLKHHSYTLVYGSGSAHVTFGNGPYESDKLYNKKAIEMIINHLGLEFKYIPETPPNVVLSNKGAE